MKNTSFVTFSPRNCVACWKCVDACPAHVIGKVQVLWHKHAKISHPKQCIGCKKCINVCPHKCFKAK